MRQASSKRAKLEGCVSAAAGEEPAIANGGAAINRARKVVRAMFIMLLCPRITARPAIFRSRWVGQAALGTSRGCLHGLVNLSSATTSRYIAQLRDAATH